MVNRVTLIGLLGRDPEVRRLENGTAVANFSVATSESYQDKTSGEWQEQTEWHEITAWRAKAEQAERILKKGMTVYIEGKLTHRKYTDKDNIERYRTEVVANYMRKIKDPKGAAQTANEPQAATADVSGAGDPSSDLPF